MVDTDYGFLSFLVKQLPRLEINVLFYYIHVCILEISFRSFTMVLNCVYMLFFLDQKELAQRFERVRSVDLHHT